MHPGLVEESKRASSCWPDSLGDVQLKETGAKVPGVEHVVETMNRPFERILELSLVDRRGEPGKSIALSLDETSMRSPANGGSARSTAGVGTREDAGCCTLKSCRRVSIVGISVFFNLSELSRSGLLLYFPYSCARLRRRLRNIRNFRHIESERLRFQ